MHIHYLKHIPFEGLGSMESYLLESGHRLSVTNLYHGDELPSPESIDLLIVMGGPMGVHDTSTYPWLTLEKTFITSVITLNKPVLGICLGAQLIASVLGAAVSKNSYREIGWFDIKLSSAFEETSLGKILPNPLKALHWHGDTFDIPKNAIALGSSDACPNQGFLYKNNVLGLQFHLEMTKSTVSRLINHCANELDNSTYVQRPEQILHQEKLFIQSNNLTKEILKILINNNEPDTI